MSKRKSQADEMYVDTITIPAGGTYSETIDLGNHVLCGVQIPAGMIGTGINVLGSIDKKTFVPIKNIAGDKLILVIDNTASMSVLSPQETSPARFIQLQSNDTETAEVVITVISIRAAESE